MKFDMDKKQLIEEILNIIKSNNILQIDNVIDENIFLFDEYGLNSIGVIDLVVCIEEKFNFEFEDTDLELSNFNTISNIANLVLTKI